MGGLGFQFLPGHSLPPQSCGQMENFHAIFQENKQSMPPASWVYMEASCLSRHEGPLLATLSGHRNPWSNPIKFKSMLEKPRPTLTSTLHWLCILGTLIASDKFIYFFFEWGCIIFNSFHLHSIPMYFEQKFTIDTNIHLYISSAFSSLWAIVAPQLSSGLII